jgi:hypothetical protein
VWPQWVSRLLFGKYDSKHFVNIRSTGDSTTGFWKSRNIDITTKTVCDKCNNVWLSNFENTEIMAIATPLITGNSKVVLSPSDQWNRILREEFVNIYSEPVMMNFFKELLKSGGVALPSLPPPGTLDIRQVLDSPYLFA